MGFNSVCDITERCLKKKGYAGVNFESGHTVLISPNVKVFFYPQEDSLRITAIPSDRKYNIEKDMHVDIEGFGNMFVKYQPNKTNSELMYLINEGSLNEVIIEDVINYMVDSTHHLFSNLERA